MKQLFGLCLAWGASLVAATAFAQRPPQLAQPLTSRQDVSLIALSPMDFRGGYFVRSRGSVHWLAILTLRLMPSFEIAPE